MASATLTAITLTCIAWSLWIRRVTRTSRWEIAATFNIALQGTALFFMSPFGSETLGRALHTLQRSVEPRGLHRPRLLRRRGIGDRLTRSAGLPTTTLWQRRSNGTSRSRPPFASRRCIVACIVRHQHGLRPGAAVDRVRDAGVVLRMHLRRGILARIGALAANQDELVQTREPSATYRSCIAHNTAGWEEDD